MNWTSSFHPPYGTTYELLTEQDGWQISFPKRHPEQPIVELRYGRRRDADQLFPTMIDIGIFASAGEAMLAARMFQDGAVLEGGAQERSSLGFKPYFQGAEKLDLKTGRTSKGSFLFMTGVGKDNKETSLVYDGPGRSAQTHTAARIWSAASGHPLVQPINARDLHGVETTILMELLRLRLTRGPGHYAVPLSVDEYELWAEDRYGRTVDPDADRPYFRAEPAIRNASASELLLENAGLREQLGIAPGYEDRVANQTDDDASRFIEALMLARAPGAARIPVLDMLDAKVAEVEARLTGSSPRF